jgi:hypothetical protein
MTPERSPYLADVVEAEIHGTTCWMNVAPRVSVVGSLAIGRLGIERQHGSS